MRRTKPKPPTATEIEAARVAKETEARRVAELRDTLGKHAAMLEALASGAGEQARDVLLIARELRTIGDPKAPSELRSFAVLRHVLEMFDKRPKDLTPEQVADAYFKMIDERRTLRQQLRLILSAAANVERAVGDLE